VEILTTRVGGSPRSWKDVNLQLLEFGADPMLRYHGQTVFWYALLHGTNDTRDRLFVSSLWKDIVTKHTVCKALGLPEASGILIALLQTMMPGDSHESAITVRNST